MPEQPNEGRRHITKGRGPAHHHTWHPAHPAQLCPNLIGQSLWSSSCSTPDRRRTMGSARPGYLRSPLHETWYRCHNRPYDGTHEVPSAIGRVKTRLPALKTLTGVHVPHESAPGPPRSRGQWQRARYTADQRVSDVVVGRRSSAACC
jgi:hypothetical protein